MNETAVFFIVYTISYPIVLIVLKTIEFYFGETVAISVGIFLIAIIILMIRKELRNE